MKFINRVLLVALVFLTFGVVSPSNADVNDFSFSSFDAKYELSLNSEKGNRAEMWVTETLVANFPQTDQNHGIRRSIPESSYGKYPGFINGIQVLDEYNQAREFEIGGDNGFVELLIKPSDGSYVHGQQTYVIKYHQAWVINNYQSSSGFDEFYWDVNGTGWLQSFDKVTATVSVNSSLRDALVPNKISCYEGPQGSTKACASAAFDGTNLVFTSGKLAAGENLTIAVPFKPNVANTQLPKVEGTPSWYGYIFSGVLLLLVIIWALYFRLFRIRNQGKKSFVVPQYKPAPSPGLLTSAFIARKTSHLYQACVVELAVKNLIEIEMVPNSKNKDFILRRTATAVENPEYKELLSVLGLAEVGSQITLGRKMPARDLNELTKNLLKLRAASAKQANSQGYFQRRALGLPALVFLVSLVAFAGLMGFGLVMDNETEAGYIALPLIGFAPFAALYWLLLSKRALTAKGTGLVTYVKGLEMYIELAEKDRLEFLQSPTGAALKPASIKGKQVLKLYEEVLPWAILLGLQKEWSAVLTNLYPDGTGPVWLIGSSQLSDSFSNLDQALTHALGASSDGGSGGGGSSGGGGGGGGGGGI